MKLLIFSTDFLPTLGGVQKCVSLLAQGLAEFSGDAQQFEVTVATETPANGMDDASLPYRVVRRPGFRALRRLVREADAVHMAGPALLPMAVAWVEKKPFFVEHHVYQAICPNGLLFRQPEKEPCPGFFMKKDYARCMKCRSSEVGWWGAIRSIALGFPRHWLCRKARANIGVTDHVTKRVDLPRSCTVYHGVADSYKQETSSGTVALSVPLEIAFVGRLVAEKGISTLLQAARRLRDDSIAFRLTIVGDGPERNRLEAMAEYLRVGDCVVFTGDLRGDDLARAVRNISVVVMPSIWEETAGLSAIEQMMRSGVVIAADIGGLAEVVGETGLKFPSGDADALAVCIRQLAQNTAKISALGASARRRANNVFHFDRMIAAHASLYHEVV